MQFNFEKTYHLMEDETIEAVRLKLHSDNMTFLEKILCLLSFMTLNPEYVTACGITWIVPDTIFYHPQLLGAFLGVKANTINLYFRAYGLEIITRKDVILQVPDLLHWVARKSTIFPLTPLTASIQEVKMRIARCATSLIVPDGDITSDKEGVVSFLRECSACWYYCVHAQVGEIWRKCLDRDNTATPGDVVSSLMVFVPETFDAYSTRQIRCNLEYLMNKLQKRKMQFNDFLKFSVQYGIGQNAVENVINLTSFCRDSDSVMAPRFVAWFQPAMNYEIAVRDLQQTPSVQWIVTEGIALKINPQNR